MGDAERGIAGAPGTRLWARPGQAIHPESVFEQERRQRIADNWKALQELVPNASKTDKESMLHEIIEYVNSLQQQVKVLSTSKMGGESTIVNVPAEGSGCPASAALVQAGGSLFQEGRDFERDVLKHMEIDMNNAMEYSQSKGLALIPIADASALSNPTRGHGSWATNVVGRQSSDKQPASQTANGCLDVLGRGSDGFGRDLPSRINKVVKESKAIKRGSEVPTSEPNGTDLPIISRL